MTRFFYTRLALDNIKKNGRTYIPYIITCIMTVSMFYIMRSLSKNPGLMKMNPSIITIMEMGSTVVGIFSFIFLIYTNSFLIKRRKKEFGVFNILGMEKKHLAKVLALETLITVLLSLFIGIVFGIALDKVMFLLIAKIVGVKTSFGFFISFDVIRYTVLFFGILFCVILLKSVFTLRMAGPVELLHGGSMGEKEPKTKWFMTLLGLAGVGAGYYIAVVTKNPLAALNAFFIAVLLVIIGTYLLFTAGSIAFLKLLKKNKRYYYQSRHFISVSGMIWRMKQNAVGLANICILSTMVLVLVSSTTSLIVGIEDIMHARFPNDFAVYSDKAGQEQNRKMVSEIRSLAAENDFPVENEAAYYYLDITTIAKGDQFITDPAEINLMDVIDSIYILVFSTLDDYNALMGEEKELKEDEILLYSSDKAFGRDTLKIFDREYQVAEELDEMYENGAVPQNIASIYYIVVSGMEELQYLNDRAVDADIILGMDNAIQYYYGFDSRADVAAQTDFFDKLRTKLYEQQYDVRTELKEASRSSMFALYGGLFFLGTFLGILFIMATVLIIYYKQISEGWEDRERFSIMQKVGLSPREVKAAIHSQVLTVFFLPLIAAGIHLTAALPMIVRLLRAINMLNTSLYIICAAVCFVIFALIYIVIYSLTARTYYRIVSEESQERIYGVS